MSRSSKPSEQPEFQWIEDVLDAVLTGIGNCFAWLLNGACDLIASVFPAADTKPPEEND